MFIHEYSVHFSPPVCLQYNGFLASGKCPTASVHITVEVGRVRACLRHGVHHPVGRAAHARHIWDCASSWLGATHRQSTRPLQDDWQENVRIEIYICSLRQILYNQFVLFFFYVSSLLTFNVTRMQLAKAHTLFPAVLDSSQICSTSQNLLDPDFARPRWSCAYTNHLHYVLEWTLVSLIPHVDGACIWLPLFRYFVYVC